MTDEKITSKIWYEEADSDNPFSAKACYCSGYDVYGELLGKASWPEYLFLLFKLERPHAWQAKLLERLMIALANPGPRDYSVRAAMSAAAGGSTTASILISALAVGAGYMGGSREIYAAMNGYRTCEKDLNLWREYLTRPITPENVSAWPDQEYPPGFELYGTSCSIPVAQTLDCLYQIHSDGHLGWLQKNRIILEEYANHPLSMSGIIAAAFLDLSFTPEEGEMLYLILRLPGAAVHGLEQHLQWKQHPFYKNGLTLLEERITAG